MNLDEGSVKVSGSSLVRGTRFATALVESQCFRSVGSAMQRLTKEKCRRTINR